MSVNKKLLLLHNRGILFYALCVRAIANCSIPIFPNKILACHPHHSYNRLKIGRGNKISNNVEFDNMDSLFYCSRNNENPNILLSIRQYKSYKKK